MKKTKQLAFNCDNSLCFNVHMLNAGLSSLLLITLKSGVFPTSIMFHMHNLNTKKPLTCRFFMTNIKFLLKSSGHVIEYPLKEFLSLRCCIRIKIKDI